MIITIVPPVGPPIPVLVGRALIQNGTETKSRSAQDSSAGDFNDRKEAVVDVYLDEQFDKDGVYLELDDMTKVFPNGTLIYRYFLIKCYLC